MGTPHNSNPRMPISELSLILTYMTALLLSSLNYWETPDIDSPRQAEGKKCWLHSIIKTETGESCKKTKVTFCPLALLLLLSEPQANSSILGWDPNHNLIFKPTAQRFSLFVPYSIVFETMLPLPMRRASIPIYFSITVLLHIQHD